MNGWDIAILAAVAGFVLFMILRRRRSSGGCHGSCCSGNCAECAGCGRTVKPPAKRSGGPDRADKNGTGREDPGAQSSCNPQGSDV